MSFSIFTLDLFLSH